MNIPSQERGAALLTVLLLVAVIAVLAAHGIDRLAGATKVTANSRELSQAKAYLVAAESIGLRSAEELLALSPGRTTNLGEWNGQEQRIPVSGGLISASLSDGGNCFNINSLVKRKQAILTAEPRAMEQFVRLMILLDVAGGDAADIAAAAADWMDSDDITANGGAEDQYYLQQAKPYRTAQALMVDPSELRAIKGMSGEIYYRLAPWLCALPIAELSPINVNTLRPEQAVLLAMLASETPDLVGARQFLGQRPLTGYASLNAFWAQPYPMRMATLPETQSQVKLTTRWFRLDAKVEMQSAMVEEKALIDAGRQPAKLVHRQRGDFF